MRRSSAWKKSQARACQNPAEIVHFRTAKFIAVFGEHQKSKESEVDNVNPGHHETPVPAAGRVIFRGTEVGFSAASIANTAQHKLASPAAKACPGIPGILPGIPGKVTAQAKTAS